MIDPKKLKRLSGLARQIRDPETFSLHRQTAAAALRQECDRETLFALIEDAETLARQVPE